MDLFGISISLILTTILIWLVHHFNKKTCQLPPGPFRWPLVGNLFQILWANKNYMHIAYAKISKKYGPIVYHQVGIVNFVTVNACEEIKTISAKDDWPLRMVGRTTLERTFDQPIGIIFADLPTWKLTRQFTERNLRSFGFGKNETTERLVMRELEDLYEKLDHVIAKKEGIFEAHNLFKIPMVNIVWSLFSNQRFNHDDPQIIKLIEYIGAYTKSLMAGGLGSMYPFLVNWAPFLTAHAQQTRANSNIRAYLKDLIQHHRQNDFIENPQNFIEIFLKNIHQSKNNGGIEKEPNNIFTDENLISILYDVFWAGTSTSSSILSFALLWLSLNPNVQDKVRQELDSVLGQEVKPSLQDRDRLNYTKATIFEIHRHSFVSPMVNRQAHKEMQIGNYTIPKGTSVLLNYYSVMMDPEFWTEPHQFQPQRFLKANGDILHSASARVTPFGCGQRKCFGEPVGGPSIFLVLTHLLKKYKFRTLPHEKPTTDPIPGILLAPRPFKLIAEHNNN